MQNEFFHINELSKQIHEDNAAKGFWLERVEVPGKMQASGEFTAKEIDFVKHAIQSQQLLLTVCEIAEGEEALRKTKHADLEAFEAAIDAGISLQNAYESFVKGSFEEEIADAIIRLLDSAGGHGVNIGRHIEAKLLYNKTRPFKHGKNA